MESPTAVEVWRNNNKHVPAVTATVTNPNPNGLASLFPILFTFQFQPNPFLTIRENSPVKSNLNTTSILSAADRCLHMFTEFASSNPLLLNLFSIPSNFRNFLQIEREKSNRRRNWSPLVSSNHNFAAILPGDSVAGVVVSNGVMNFLNIYNTLLVVRLVLTWFPNSPPAIVSPLSTLCDPYLNIFRGIIPPLGGLDLSPILAFLVLNAFTSTAAALPAELPSSTSAQPYIALPKAITSSQEKWLKRIHPTTTSNGVHETETRS